MRRALRPAAACLLGLAVAAVAAAHEVTGGLGDAASATDLYQITCSNDGNGAPASLLAYVLDLTPVAAPLVSVQVQRGSLLQSSTDPADADNDPSPAITVNGGTGAYDVLVDKTGTGSESYTLTFHCMTGSGIHTGTAHSVKQNQ